jgi:hypothetical protein
MRGEGFLGDRKGTKLPDITPLWEAKSRVSIFADLKPLDANRSDFASRCLPKKSEMQPQHSGKSNEFHAALRRTHYGSDD